MTFLYTARAIYNRGNTEEDQQSWNKYIAWSKLTHLTELVSLGTGLNEVLVEPNRDSAEDWSHIVVADCFETGFFTTPEFVLKKTKKTEKFNLLAVVIAPEQDCAGIRLDNYNFLGYDLLDQYYSNSALTNCGGFDETFLPDDLNNLGLIDNYHKAYDIRKRLEENNPGEEHADTNVIAIWRHQVIGR